MRRMLAPRRPKRKATAEEREGWLVQHDLLLPDDTCSLFSYSYHVRPLLFYILSSSDGG